MLLRYGFVCLILSLASCRIYRPAPERSLASLTGAPIFIVPLCDSANGIERVYFSESSTKNEDLLEVTVVFRDEDQPFIVWDLLYDAFRQCWYHRKKDIETLYLHREPGSHHLVQVDFGDASGREQSFYTPLVRHFHDLIPAGQPQKDTNEAFPKTIYRNYASYSGARKDAEPQRH
jgi:hypothetical protein